MSRYGTKCNVTACNEQHDFISHADTQLYYCWFCARKINDYNPNDIIFTDEEMAKGREIRAKREKI